MSVKIELGFTEVVDSNLFLLLDDPVRGTLDDPNNVLGGEVLVDVTEYFQNYSVTRGKNRELEKFNAAQLSITFENSNRFFDPTYQASPYFGQIVPRRRIVVTKDNVIQFDGLVDDWNIDFSPGGQSIASAQAFDAFSAFANLTLDELVAPEETTSQRITRVLDAIGWPQDKRDLDFGGNTLAAQTIEEGTNVLSYLTLVSVSEQGDVFISKDGKVKFSFRDASTENNIVFSDTGDDVNYTSIQSVYGSELLFNNITVASDAGQETAEDEVSVAVYGERDLKIITLLNDTEQLQGLASVLLGRFSEPELRFESLNSNLRALPEDDRLQLESAELGDISIVRLTPGNIPPQIEVNQKIIGIQTSVSPDSEQITFNFQKITIPLILDDLIFGKLGESILGKENQAWTLGDPILGRLSAGMTLS